jgi:hypothetical protein
VFGFHRSRKFRGSLSGRAVPRGVCYSQIPLHQPYLVCALFEHLCTSEFGTFSHRPPEATTHYWGRSFGRLFWRTGKFLMDISAPSLLIRLVKLPCCGTAPVNSIVLTFAGLLPSPHSAALLLPTHLCLLLSPTK